MNDAASPSDPVPTAPPDRFAEALRGFGPVGILSMLVVTAGNFLMPPLSAVLALVWAGRSRTPWSELGLVRPRSWARELLIGGVFGAALKLVLKAVVMPLLGADPVNHAYHYLAGNPSAALPFILQILVVAAVGEEIFFRGFLFQRFGTLLGSGAGAKAVAVVFTSALFAAEHYSVQGVTGVEQAAITGLVFGTLYAVTGRLWMIMCAHAAFDLVALAVIYWGQEARVAHLIFK